MDKPTKGICVDGSYVPSLKLTEWRLVDIETNEELYRNGLYSDTPYLNNIAEILALIRGIHYVISNNLDLTVYSDSTTALGWIKNEKVNTTIENEKLLELVNAGMEYVSRMKATRGLPKIEKWLTKEWGENPSDFNRK